METAAQSKPSLSTQFSTSFRLRSPSLNSVRLRRIFDVFDKNHDDMLTVEELSQALGLLGLDTDVSEIEPMIRSYIQPGNPGLTYQDFESLHCSLHESFFGSCIPEEADCGSNNESDVNDEADLNEAFKVFDEDGDGFISAKELQTVLGKLGLQEGKEIGKVEMMISSVDQDHDGRVNFDEFKNMMRSVVVPCS